MKVTDDGSNSDAFSDNADLGEFEEAGKKKTCVCAYLDDKLNESRAVSCIPAKQPACRRPFHVKAFILDTNIPKRRRKKVGVVREQILHQ